MKYEIESRSDFKTGAVLVVRIPEDEVDKNALNTILADKPGFILPFHHRAVDGQIEITYQTGNYSKLSYLSAGRSPDEYVDLLFNLLQPLVDCSDWFMKPFSCVLDSDYLYCDRSGKTIVYLYIPSVKDCSDFDALKGMVSDVAKQNRVTDTALENKVVWALADFNPIEFLQMLKPYRGVKTPEAAAIPVAPSAPVAPATPAPDLPPVQPEGQSGLWQKKPAPPAVPTPAAAPAPQVQAAAPAMPGDIVINLASGGKAPKEKKKKEPKPEPKAKEKEKEKGGFFGWKKSKKDNDAQDAPQRQSPAAVQTQAPPQMQGPAFIPTIDDTENEKTQLLGGFNPGTPKFRYIGSGNHPRMIEVGIDEGAIFSIGRFDVSVGVKQTDFEFDAKTKAVSRRHAVVERKADGYYIVDMGSSAGTFYNGKMLPQNAPFKLEPDCRISFGNLGADYIWEG